MLRCRGQRSRGSCRAPLPMRIAKELTRSPDAVFLMLPQSEMSGLMAGSRALDMKMHDGSSRPLENAKVMLKCMDVNLKCTFIIYMFGPVWPNHLENHSKSLLVTCLWCCYF